MESFQAKLKQQVYCSLCNETLCDPKLLECFHVFCKTCIKSHTQVIEEEENTSSVFQCPECNSQILLRDPNDVEDLQISPIHSKILKVLEVVENQTICSISPSHQQALWQCLDCNQSMCEECLRCHSKMTKNHKVVSLSDLKKEDIEKMLREEPPCQIHDGNNVKFHCQDCDMLICLLCLEEGHHEHKTIALQEVVAIEKDVLSKKLEQINRMSTDEKEKNRQGEIALRVKTDGERATKEVKELTKTLIQTIKDNEQELLNIIQKSVTKADRNLRVLLHTTQAQEYIQNLMENGTASDMMATRHDASSQNFTYEPFDPSSPRVEFRRNEDLCEQVEYGFGQIKSSFGMSGPKMNSVRIEPSDLRAMQKAKLRIVPKTSKISLKNVQVEFTPDDSVKVGGMQKTYDNDITVDFIPRVSGQVKAEVKLHGNPIANKPTTIFVQPQQLEKETFLEEVKRALNRGSKNFTGIAVNKTKNIIAVSDSASDCIRIYDKSKFTCRTYGSKDSKELNYPQGIAFLNETDLVIADKCNNRICIVDTVKLELLKTFGSHGRANGQFNCPLGVYADDHPNIIVCDNGNNRVQVFRKNGEFLYKFDAPQPYSVVTHNGLFYVSVHVNYGKYKANSAVYVIKMKDTVHGTCTTEATICNKEYFGLWVQSHCGLAIDNEYNLLVCDYNARLIHKFTLDGRYIGRSSQLAKGPRYIAVMNNYVIMCTTGGGGVVSLALV